MSLYYLYMSYIYIIKASYIKGMARRPEPEQKNESEKEQGRESRGKGRREKRKRGREKRRSAARLALFSENESGKCADWWNGRDAPGKAEGGFRRVGYVYNTPLFQNRRALLRRKSRRALLKIQLFRTISQIIFEAV